MLANNPLAPPAEEMARGDDEQELLDAQRAELAGLDGGNCCQSIIGYCLCAYLIMQRINTLLKNGLQRQSVPQNRATAAERGTTALRRWTSGLEWSGAYRGIGVWRYKLVLMA